MDEPKVTLLKEEAERVYGRKILSASDCEFLGREIFERTQLKVSVNTLRRLFNLMASKYQASLYTLDVLAKYCGFTGYSDFIMRGQKSAQEAPDHDSGLLDLLILMFKDTDHKSINDPHFFALIDGTISRLSQWPNIIDQFHCRIAKTVNGQRIYFEQFINIDKLNSYFGEGLRYYLHEKRKPEAQLFGHSLLCFNSWLTGNQTLLHHHYRETIRYNIDETTDMFLCARYFSVELFYYDVTGKALAPILDKARDFQSSANMFKPDANAFPGFEYIMAETLVLLQQYDEALYYIHRALKKRNSHVSTYMNAKMYESICLFQATALWHSGKTEKARDIFDTINTTNFHFLSKQYNTILYILLKRKMDRGKNYDKQLCYLVQQTGFRQLYSGNDMMKAAS